MSSSSTTDGPDRGSLPDRCTCPATNFTHCPVHAHPQKDSDRSGSPPELKELLGEPMTAEDWVESAGWWIERGGALPEASPMFKALVDVVQECQRRSKVRDGFGADACDQDRVDGPTRDLLQRLYGSVELLAERSAATADSQYEDVKALEVIVGDLRAEVTRLKEEQVSLVGSLGDAQAETEKLREQYTALQRTWHKSIDALHLAVVDAARLREALDMIAAGEACGPVEVANCALGRKSDGSARASDEQEATT